MNNFTFAAMRLVLCWKQDFFGMLFGMGKQAISRFETGKRSETIAHKETLAFLAFLDEKDLLDEYVNWRFGISISKRFYINSTPMANCKYLIKKQSSNEWLNKSKSEE